MNSICKDCGICCLDTEMILSDKDILKIEQNNSYIGKSSLKYYYEKDGFKQLRNIENHCIFFDIDTQQCDIYDYRPEGCRFYPMIYDIDQDKCILDQDCPRKYRFYKEEKKFKSSCVNLKQFIQEIYKERK